MRCGNCRLAFYFDDSLSSTQSALTINVDSAHSSLRSDELPAAATTDQPTQEPKQSKETSQSDWLEQFNELLEKDKELEFDESVISTINEDTEYFDVKSQSVSSQESSQQTKPSNEAPNPDTNLVKSDELEGKASPETGFNARDTKPGLIRKNRVAQENDLARTRKPIISDSAIADLATSSSELSIQDSTDADLLTPNRIGLAGFTLNLVSLAIICLLAALLLLQLHQRQWVDWFNSSRVEPLASEAANVVSKYVLLPSKTQVGKLELVSAVISEHPTRSSTVLMQIRILNHAEFDQNLPSLQLTLLDTDGRIISRRTISPDLYTHNNSTTTSLKSRELKPVSIELLDFPTNTEGFEVKIISLEK